VNLLSWLEQEKEFPKVYWKEKGSSQTLAGCGASDACNSLPLAPTQPYFGGVAFPSARKDSLWNAFPESYFFSPKTLRCEVESRLLEPFCVPQPAKTSHTPDLATWKRSLQQIAAEKLDKVVLARRTTCIYPNPINPFDILRGLLSFAPYCTLFLFQPSPDCSFVGATPEHLYRRQHEALSADALAGTTPLHQPQNLLREKERREFSYVKTFLQEKLSPLCSAWSWHPEDQIVSTSRMHHLYNRFSGILHTRDDAALLNLLHPTPAVGGYPQGKALEYLQREEPFDRGWYSAPLGWVGPENTTFAVAIRSALIRDKELHAFAAAGIVQGSDAEKEWDELNLKTNHFIKV